MKYSFILLVFLTGCAKGLKFDTFKSNTPGDFACTGIRGTDPGGPPLHINNGDVPDEIPADADYFYVTDVFALNICAAPYRYYPGVANQPRTYSAGQTLVAYITSASFAMRADYIANVDIRLALFDVALGHGMEMMGAWMPGEVGLTPKYVGTFYYLINKQPSGMILGAVTPFQAFRTFNPPLKMAFTIPDDWDGAFQVGTAFQFNSGGTSNTSYQYHLEGWIKAY